MGAKRGTGNGPAEYFHHPMIVRIRERCGALGVNQTTLAKHMDKSHATGSRWFAGETFPTRQQVLELEDSLGLERGELLLLGGYLPGDNARIRRTDGGGFVIEIDPDSLAPRAHMSIGWQLALPLAVAS
jgi:transcriptional regulator with XRE-family HTH domain